MGDRSEGKPAFTINVKRHWDNAGQWQDYDVEHPGLSAKLESQYEKARAEGEKKAFLPSMPDAFKVDGRSYDVHMGSHKPKPKSWIARRERREFDSSDDDS